MLLQAIVLLPHIHLAWIEPSAAAPVHSLLAISQQGCPLSHSWCTSKANVYKP